MSSPVLFQFLPPLAPDEYAALEASIREYGVQVPILVDEDGVVIDGHHRSAIAEHLGVHCPRTRVFDKTDAEKRTLALTLNLDRRNLNREQRRAIVEASVKADPHLSDRAHAQRTGVSHPTVARVRAQVEQVERFTTSTPEPERINPITGEVVPAPTFQPTNVTDWTAEEVDDLMASDEAVIEAWKARTVPAPPKITGLDGKSYTRPEPVQREARRSPLPDSFWRATFDLTKKVESIVRLCEDDRFAQNTEKVALANRSDLIRAIEALQRVVDQLPERNNS